MRCRSWRPLVVDFRGPRAAASDSNPNPFLDYRLQTEWIGPSGQRYDVPGYFAGDGAGGSTGDVWRVVFSPDEAGPWRYRVSFRQRWFNPRTGAFVGPDAEVPGQAMIALGPPPDDPGDDWVVLLTRQGE